MELISPEFRTLSRISSTDKKSRSAFLRNGSFVSEKIQAQTRLRRINSELSPRRPSVAVAGSGMDRGMLCVFR